MGADRYSVTEIRCAMLWRLARNHGWAQWIPEERLIRAVPSHERGRARRTLAQLSEEPFIHRHPRRGIRIAHRGIERLAHQLRDDCGISEFRIETTLSHFGGFE